MVHTRRRDLPDRIGDKAEGFRRFELRVRSVASVKRYVQSVAYRTPEKGNDVRVLPDHARSHALFNEV